eukprot:scaffold102581_cov57-Phaeocystis_antarctica.AAC.1
MGGGLGGGCGGGLDGGARALDLVVDARAVHVAELVHIVALALDLLRVAVGVVGRLAVKHAAVLGVARIDVTGQASHVDGTLALDDQLVGRALHPLARRVGRRRGRRHGARLAHVGEVALVGLDETVDALAVGVVRLAANVRGVARGSVVVVDLAPGGRVHVAQRGQAGVVSGLAVVGRQGRRRRGRRRRGRRRRGRRRRRRRGLGPVPIRHAGHGHVLGHRALDVGRQDAVRRRRVADGRLSQRRCHRPGIRGILVSRGRRLAVGEIRERFVTCARCPVGAERAGCLTSLQYIARVGVQLNELEEPSGGPPRRLVVGLVGEILAIILDRLGLVTVVIRRCVLLVTHDALEKVPAICVRYTIFN